jgi:hypothetical protein
LLKEGEVQSLKTNEKLVRISKVDEIMDSLIHDAVEFSYFDFVKAAFSMKKSLFIYNYCLENLKRMMNIDTYLKFNLEMTLIKEVLFDKSQILTFDAISKMINFKKFFDKSEEEFFDIKSYDKTSFDDFFKSVQIIMQRQNNTDRKLINNIFTK